MSGLSSGPRTEHREHTDPGDGEFDKSDQELLAKCAWKLTEYGSASFLDKSDLQDQYAPCARF